MWDFARVAEDVAEVVELAERALQLEQAVYGIDSFEELKLQSIVAAGLKQRYEVAREVHYPSSAGNKLTHRRRCDIVLSPTGRPLKLDSKPASLFDPPNQTAPDAALWLEVKIAKQFKEFGVRHGGYGQQWRTAVVDDLKKIEAEPLIHDAGLLLLVFTESLEVLEKDLQLFEDTLVRKEVLAGFRKGRSTRILDRMGHQFATIALWPTIQR